MDRCVILVDAGYLLGAAGSLLETDRSGLFVDYAALTRKLIAQAETQCRMPVLRLLWYDGAPNAHPQPEHRALRVLPDVKVRLGDLVTRGGRTQQKGVDSYLQRDLTTLARNRSVADVVLLGGDEDLRRGVEEAQDYGVRVHLWGVEAAAPEYNQSPSLIAEADRRWVMPRESVTQFVSLPESEAIEPTTTGAQGTATMSTTAETDTGAGGASPAGTTARPASPADLARLAAYTNGPSTNGPSTNGPYTNGRGTPAAGGRGGNVVSAEREIPRLRDLTSDRQSWLDNEQDATQSQREPLAVGERFGRRWAERADSEQFAALLAKHPRGPNYLDGELLRYAVGCGIDTWDDDEAKFAVRDGFWKAMLAAAGRDGTGETPSS